MYLALGRQKREFVGDKFLSLLHRRLVRLLVGLLLGFVVGAAVQLQQRALFESLTYAVLTGAALIGLGLVLWLFPWLFTRQFGRPWLGWLAAFTLSAILAFGLTGVRASSFASAALNPALEGQDIDVTGKIVAMPQFGEDGVRFRFAVASAYLKGKQVSLPPQIYLGWYSGFGLRHGKAAPVAVPAADGEVEPPEFSLELQRQPQPLRAGEHWQMTVRLKAPHGNSNPHGFDYELWLWEQSIQATGYVRTGKSDTPPKKLAATWAKPVERARQTVREAIFERVDNRQLAGVLAALVVGDQNAIERADWDVFRATGVAHLMSISGLHITMFAWAASLVLGWLWRRSAQLTPALCLWLPASSAGAWGGLALAALYALFAGWGVPAQRTIWMLATVVILRQSGRQWPWPVVWLLAMVVVVVLDPWALMQAGFWLSFVAVGVLFAASDSTIRSKPNTTDSGADRARIHWPNDLNDRENKPETGFLSTSVTSFGAHLMKTLREQWVITLALTPLSLLLFNQVSLVGLLANAVAIPWVTLVVTPLAMLGALWAPSWDAAALAVNALMLLLQWMASYSWASVSVAAAPLWCAVAGVIGGVLLVMRLPPYVRALGVPLLLPVLLWQPLRPEAGQFEILGADVGQGNALIVRTASHSLVYDTGPRFSRESDAGNRVLVPLLRAMGEKIDLLMLSHRDMDHIGGAPAVLAMQPQARLVSSIEDGHELHALRRSERCLAGQKWRWDGVDFEVLHPLASDYESKAKSNAMSCVLRISNGLRTALLAGDLEAAQELRLTANPELSLKLKADFLLMPHHGSKTSSTGPFLNAVQPRFALAQAGYRNRFNHPVESVLARYADRQIRVIKSPVCGAATWRSVQADEVLCQRQQAMRYWHHQPNAAR